MIFENLTRGTILKRYKRFLADIELQSGELVIAHTPNTGSMKTCWDPGWPALCSYHDDPKRKLKYGLQMLHNGVTWIGVNTSITNKLGIEAIKNGSIPELQGYETIRPEFKVGQSRLDILLYNGDLDGESERCYVEIKNVTMLGDDGVAVFPDSVSTRGQKHLKELMQLKSEGNRAVMLFIIQREDTKGFRAAKDIDPEYDRLLNEAMKSGVEVLCYQCTLTPEEIKVDHREPIQ